MNDKFTLPRKNPISNKTVQERIPVKDSDNNVTVPRGNTINYNISEVPQYVYDKVVSNATTVINNKIEELDNSTTIIMSENQPEKPKEGLVWFKME